MSVLSNPSACVNSLFLSCEKALALDWTIQEEKYRSQAETQVISLRKRDRRFGAKVVGAKLCSQDVVKRCIENLDRICHALDSDNLITVKTACDELTCLVNLDENGIIACKLLPVLVLNRNGQLAEAACFLKRALMDFPTNSKLWIARGEVFLRMEVAALADMHFKQPCTKDPSFDRLRFDCRTRMLESIPTLSSLSHVDPEELCHRGDVFRDEAFIKSAVYHFAAGFKYGTGDIQKQCFLKLIQSVYLLDNIEIWADFALNAIDWAMQHYSTMYLEMCLERAHWLFAYRDYASAAEELLHLKEQRKGILTQDETRLLRNIEKKLRSNAYSRVFPSRYRIGRILGTGDSVSRVRVDEKFVTAGEKVILWIFGQNAIPLDLASKESAICLGNLVGSIPDELAIPAGSRVTVHDFRTCSWFVSHRSKRLFRKYDSQIYLHFICTNEMLVVCPLRAVSYEGNKAMQDIQITWSDIRQTIIRITSPKSSNLHNEENNVLTECLAQGTECRRSILQLRPHEHSLCDCSNISSAWSAIDTFDALKMPMLGLTLESLLVNLGKALITKPSYPNLAVATLVGGFFILMIAMILSPMNL